MVVGLVVVVVVHGVVLVLVVVVVDRVGSVRGLSGVG